MSIWATPVRRPCERQETTDNVYGDPSMRYMMFISHTEDYRKQTPPQALFDAMDKFVQKSFKSGVLVDTAGLQPTSAGTRLHLSKGKLKITDGPFTESKEV